MKNFFSMLFMLTVICNYTYAQYCGNSNPSGSNQCTPPADTFHTPGFYPKSDLFPELINGTPVNTTITLKNFDTIGFGGQVITITWLKIDTIKNLPDGLCWATNKPDNTFYTSEVGCIKLNGITCSLPGQYLSQFLIHTNFGNVPMDISDDGPGVLYYIRVKNAGDADNPVDTTQTRSHPFISYNETISGCVAGIAENNETISSLGISPNPGSGISHISFFAEEGGDAEETIFDINGRVLYLNELRIFPGPNIHELDNTNLTNGIYIYSLRFKSNSIKRSVIIAR